MGTVNKDSSLHPLLMTFPNTGSVKWIGIRPARKKPLRPVTAVEAVKGLGVEGDHWSGSANGRRQVTLIQQEHLDAVASFLRLDGIDPGETRRNIVVTGINLSALRDRRFRIGDAVLEWSGECHPCSRMEENLGAGGYNAMRGHGGITARVLEGGTIRVGDAVEAITFAEQYA